MSSTFPCFHSNHTSMYSEGHVPYRDHVKKSVIGHKVYSRPSLALVHFNPFPRPGVQLTLGRPVGRPGVPGYLSVYVGVSLCLPC